MNDDLIDKINMALTAFDGLEDELEPYIDEWNSFVAREYPRYSPGYTWYSYPGRHHRVRYSLDLESSTTVALVFSGSDGDGDHHSYAMPVRYITNPDETEAEQIEYWRNEALRRAQARLDQEEQRKADRRRQYEKLREEFEPDARRTGPVF